MTTSLAQITITRSSTGWMVACSCAFESWHARRPAADRDAHQHRKGHGNHNKGDLT